jgi:hypothetical protein
MKKYYTNTPEKNKKIKEIQADLYRKIETFYGYKSILTLSFDFEKGVILEIRGTTRKVHSLYLGVKNEEDGLNNIRKGIEKRNDFEKTLGEGTEIIWNTFFDVETMRWKTKETIYYIKTFFCTLQGIEKRISLVEGTKPNVARKLKKKKKMMELYNIEVLGSPLCDEIELEISEIVQKKSEELQITLHLMDDKINEYINEALNEARQIISE